MRGRKDSCIGFDLINWIIISKQLIKYSSSKFLLKSIVRNDLLLVEKSFKYFMQLWWRVIKFRDLNLGNKVLKSTLSSASYIAKDLKQLKYPICSAFSTHSIWSSVICEGSKISSMFFIMPNFLMTIFLNNLSSEKCWRLCVSYISRVFN